MPDRTAGTGALPPAVKARRPAPAAAFAAAALAAFALVMSQAALLAQDDTRWKTHTHQGQPPFTVKAPEDFEGPQNSPEYLMFFDLTSESGDTYFYLGVDLPKPLPGNAAEAGFKGPGEAWDLAKLDLLWAGILKDIKGVKTSYSGFSVRGEVPALQVTSVEADGEITRILASEFLIQGDRMHRLDCGINSFGGGSGPTYPIMVPFQCAAFFESFNLD